jgi:hypothetical protein
MKRILIVATVSAALACTVILIAADTARERKLQQAIDLIETKGDAAKAVPLLEDVGRSSDKALAARGLLYLGHAQERQGGDRARATYQRIVREFGSQKTITNFDLSPDGTRVVYAARSDKWELWALDNVASAWGGR